MNVADDISALLGLEGRRGAALVQRDHAALSALFSDDLVHMHSTGERMNKTELLHYVMEVLQFLSVTRADLEVRVRGDVAVMTGKMLTTMERSDRPGVVVTADSMVTQVWARARDGWRQCNFHACRAPGLAKA
jgi:ketosteroid isomerase-like protein